MLNAINQYKLATQLEDYPDGSFIPFQFFDRVVSTTRYGIKLRVTLILWFLRTSMATNGRNGMAESASYLLKSGQ